MHRRQLAAFSLFLTLSAVAAPSSASSDPVVADPAEAVRAYAEALAGSVRSNRTSAEAALVQLRSHPAFPLLDRASVGVSLLSQVRTLRALTEVVGSHVYTDKNNALVRLIDAEVRHALESTANGGLGLGDKIGQAAAKLSSASDADAYLSCLPNAGFGNHLWYYNGARRMQQIPAQRWKASGLFPSSIAASGDVTIAVRRLDGLNAPLIDDEKAIAAVAARAFPRFVERSKPLSDAELTKFHGRSVAELPGDESLTLLVRLAIRPDTSPKDRATILAAAKTMLEGLPRLFDEERRPETRPVASLAHQSIWRAFAQTDLALAHPAWAAEWAMSANDRGLSQRLVGTPAGLDALKREIVTRGYDFAARFKALGVELDHPTEAALVKATLDRGTDGFVSPAHARTPAISALSEDFFESLARHPELHEHPHVHGFVLGQAEAIHQAYVQQPLRRVARSGDMYLTSDAIDSTLGRAHRLLRAATSMGPTTYLALGRSLLFERTWHRDGWAGEVRHIAALNRAYLEHAVSLQAGALDDTTRAGLTRDTERLAKVLPLLEQPEEHTAGDTHARWLQYRAFLRATAQPEPPAPHNEAAPQEQRSPLPSTAPQVGAVVSVRPVNLKNGIRARWSKLVTSVRTRSGLGK